MANPNFLTALADAFSTGMSDTMALRGKTQESIAEMKDKSDLLNMQKMDQMGRQALMPLDMAHRQQQLAQGALGMEQTRGAIASQDVQTQINRGLLGQQPEKFGFETWQHGRTKEEAERTDRVRTNVGTSIDQIVADPTTPPILKRVLPAYRDDPKAFLDFVTKWEVAEGKRDPALAAAKVAAEEALALQRREHAGLYARTPGTGTAGAPKPLTAQELEKQAMERVNKTLQNPLGKVVLDSLGLSDPAEARRKYYQLVEEAKRDILQSYANPPFQLNPMPPPPPAPPVDPRGLFQKGSNLLFGNYPPPQAPSTPGMSVAPPPIAPTAPVPARPTSVSPASSGRPANVPMSFRRVTSPAGQVGWVSPSDKLPAGWNYLP